MSLPDERIVEELASIGYAIVPNFVDYSVVSELRNELLQLQVANSMRRAGVGQGTNLMVRDELRGDSICWIDHADSGTPHSSYLGKLELLRQTVNKTLMLGLFEYEGHFAIYPPGAFYHRHLDHFQQDAHRTLTCILYLNRDWKEGDGGQLRLYLEGEGASAKYLDILPVAGTLVTFLSANFWHEVLPATRERMSVTGWFKTRAL